MKEGIKEELDQLEALAHEYKRNGRQTQRREPPILIVTYKNHALDQFLEGCLTFTKKIVRIGGGSKNETLQQYNLMNIFLTQLNGPDRWNYAKVKQELKARMDKIRGMVKEIKEIATIAGIGTNSNNNNNNNNSDSNKTRILTPAILRAFATENQLATFGEITRKNIAKWLAVNYPVVVEKKDKKERTKNSNSNNNNQDGDDDDEELNEALRLSLSLDEKKTASSDRDNNALIKNIDQEIAAIDRQIAQLNRSFNPANPDSHLQYVLEMSDLAAKKKDKQKIKEKLLSQDQQQQQTDNNDEDDVWLADMEQEENERRVEYYAKGYKDDEEETFVDFSGKKKKKNRRNRKKDRKDNNNNNNNKNNNNNNSNSDSSESDEEDNDDGEKVDQLRRKVNDFVAKIEVSTLDELKYSGNNNNNYTTNPFFDDDEENSLSLRYNNLWEMPIQHRRQLAEEWIRRYTAEFEADYEKMLKQYQEFTTEMAQLNANVRLSILQVIIHTLK